MRRNEQQSAMDNFNKRIGRPSAAAPYVRAAAPVPAPVQSAAPPPQSAPQPVHVPRQAQPLPASAAAAAAAAAPMPYSNVSFRFSLHGHLLLTYIFSWLSQHLLRLQRPCLRAAARPYDRHSHCQLLLLPLLQQQHWHREQWKLPG